MQVAAPAIADDLRGTVTCITWTAFRADPRLYLCFGTADGFVVFWRQIEMGPPHLCGREPFLVEAFSRRIGTGHQVTSLAYQEYQSAAVRVAIGTAENILQVREFTSDGDSVIIFSMTFEDTIPQVLRFTPTGDVTILGLQDGRLLVSITSKPLLF